MSTTERIEGVLVVGAGYAGLHAARAAARRGVPATLVDPCGIHGFTTRLAAVAGGTAGRGDAFAPLAVLAEHVRTGRVIHVEDGSVQLDDGSILEADAVVVTAGARPIWPDLPGIDKALPLRTAGDALRLRRAIAGSDALAIVGGGATGVQLAGSAAVANPGLHVTLIDREPALLTGMGAALGDHVETVLSGRGVTLDLETELASVDQPGLELSDGRSVGGLVVWAGGFESVVDELGGDLPTDEGRLRVDPDLRVCGRRRTFAAGDVVAHRDRSGELFPMSAQIAVQAGKAAGRNAARLVDGRETEPAALTHRGWVLDLAGGRGVAKVGPVSLAGPGVDRLAPLLHLGIDLRHLVEIGGLEALRFAPGRHHPASASVTAAMSRPNLPPKEAAS